MATELANMNTESYNRAKHIKEFEDTKMGVKGLADSGITTIPRFFVHSHETLPDLTTQSNNSDDHHHLIPTIDLSKVHDSDLRSAVVDKVACASREVGFFQIINHGMEKEFLDRMIGAIKRFHEQQTDIKAKVYRRDTTSGVAYFSNIDIFHSNAASWRDSLIVKLGTTLPELDEIPEICRKEVLEWDERVRDLGDVLIELLCEGLGLDKGRLKSFSKGPMMAGNYYPHCPQPQLTMGIQSHTDPGAFGILLPDSTGRLQVKMKEEWVDVEYIPAALIFNIGDTLQILSNDEYKSVEHRLLANSREEPRVSLVVFFHPDDRDKLYGPLPELLSPEKPAIYKQFNYKDYIKAKANQLDNKTLHKYRL